MRLPGNLKTLNFGDNFNQSLQGVRWPSNLQALHFGKMFNQPLHAPLPGHLRSLRFGFAFDQRLDEVPQTLEILVLGTSFKQRLEGVRLPANLKSLTMGSGSASPVDAVKNKSFLSCFAFVELMFFKCNLVNPTKTIFI